MTKFRQKVSIYDLVTKSKFPEKISALSKIIKKCRPGGGAIAILTGLQTHYYSIIIVESGSLKSHLLNKNFPNCKTLKLRFISN